MATYTTGVLQLPKFSVIGEAYAREYNDGFERADQLITKARRGIPNTAIAFDVNDTTPSVAAGSNFKTRNTSTTAITMFDGGTLGQQISVEIGDSFTSLVQSSSLRLRRSNTTVYAKGDVITLFAVDAGSGVIRWMELESRKDPVDHGAVIFPSAVQVTDWITSSTTTPTTVDFSNEGVPAEAAAIILKWRWQYTSGTGGQELRYTSPFSGAYASQPIQYTPYLDATTFTTVQTDNFILELPSNGSRQILFNFSVSNVTSVNTMHVRGYIL